MKVECPNCKCDDTDMLEYLATFGNWMIYLCNSCSKTFKVAK